MTGLSENIIKCKMFKSLLIYLTFPSALFQSPDGKYIACGAIDGIINIFDMTTGKLLHTLEGW